MTNSVIHPAQKRKPGRPRKTPNAALELPKFRTSAKLDTINVSVVLPVAIHCGDLHNRIVKALDCHSLDITVRSEVKQAAFTKTPVIFVQDPTPERLCRLAEALPAPIGIERLDVAVDFKPANTDDLDDLALILARHLSPRITLTGTSVPLFDRPRQFISTRVQHLDQDEGVNPIEKGNTVWFGAEKAPLSWRVYPKRTDRKRSIPREQYVARVEAVIQDEELIRRGIRTLDDVLALDTRTFVDLFKFAEVATPTATTGIEKLDRTRAEFIKARSAGSIALFPTKRRIAVDRLNRAAQRALARHSRTVEDANSLDKSPGTEP